MSDIKFFEINGKGQAFEARDGKWVMRSDVTRLIEESKLHSHNKVKAEIADDMKNVLFHHQNYSHQELVTIIEGWEQQLSAVD